MKDETIKAEIDSVWVATEAAGMVYKQGKAKIFNVLESQLNDDQKLLACKRIVTDILTNISRDVGSFIEDTLGDWKQEVEFGGEVSEEDAAEAAREYEEIKEVLRR